MSNINKDIFKQNLLNQEIRSILPIAQSRRLFCLGKVLPILGLVALPVYAQEAGSDYASNAQVSAQVSTENVEQPNNAHQSQSNNNRENQQGIDNKSIVFGFDPVIYQTESIDSNSVNQAINIYTLQEQVIKKSEQEFRSDAVYQLNEEEIPQVDTAMVNEIYQIAQQAKQQAEQEGKQIPSIPELIRTQKDTMVYAENQPTNTAQSTAEQTENMTHTLQQADDVFAKHQDQSEAPNVDEVLSTLSKEQITVPEIDLTKENTETDVDLQPEAEKHGFFYNLFHGKEKTNYEQLEKIKVTVKSDNQELKKNIEAILSTFTVDAFADYDIALPQIRALTTQAVQALGYYHAQLKFTKESEKGLLIDVVANQPVRVTTQNIEFFGAGATKPVFMAIQLAPDLNIGDIFNHGLYENTKLRISNAASEQGYFDAYWLMHDVKVTLADDTVTTTEPQKETVDINLRYETGERYKIQDVEFRMSDAKKPFPLRQDVLKRLVPFKEGDDYASWRVTQLSNNLINTRYFNWTTIEVIRPDAIEKPLELPDDIKTLLAKEQQASTNTNTNAEQKNQPNHQNVANSDDIFIGTQQDEVEQAQQDAVQSSLTEAEKQQQEYEQRKIQTRETKSIPVIVTLNTDKLNNLEAGFGYGTDTGVRLRSQYRRAIVNDRGHSFESSLELSKVKQSIDGLYNIPYKSPLNNYFSLIGGYERETNAIGSGIELDTESAVAGVDYYLKKPLGEWQHNVLLRYRLDQIKTKGQVDDNLLPDAFRVMKNSSYQESLLFGYQISKTSQDNTLNPNKGFYQSYRIEAGSKNLLTETDLAKLKINWKFIYSLGKDNNHQFVGRTELGYIFTNDFNRVPYNLRFFAGGDQSIRGYDYKSLSPTVDGLLLGGQSLLVGSMEYNYQFKPDWRAAIFADAGNAYDKKFSNKTKLGVGLGIRWASPIGPIRIDVGAGVSEPKIPIRLHFFIGPAL